MDEEEGWEEWLHRQRLWDEELPRPKLYTRYLKLSRIRFTAIPEAEWWRFYRDLLPLERGLACGEAIGYVNRPFWFKVVDERPICMRAASLPPEERAWLRQHMQKQQRLGVVRKLRHGVDPTPTFVSNVVLVKGGQLQ